MGVDWDNSIYNVQKERVDAALLDRLRIRRPAVGQPPARPDGEAPMPAEGGVNHEPIRRLARMLIQARQAVIIAGHGRIRAGA